MYAGFLLLTVFALIVGALVTGTYASRYALGAVIGLGPLAVIALRSAGAPAAWIRTVTVVMGLVWVGRELVQVQHTRWQRGDLAGRIGWICSTRIRACPS